MCNASIEMVKQDIDTKIADLKSEQIVNTNEDKKAVSKDTFPGETFGTDDIFDTDNIFKEFEDALAEYEEQDEYVEEIQSQKLSAKNGNDPVGNLVAETNKFLMELETKYNSLSEQIKTLEDLTAEPVQTVDPELEDKMHTKMVKLEAKFEILLKNLESKMEGEDSDIRHDINMRMEDVNVLRKTTTSRLSVYETRIDMLEQLVLKYSTQTTEPTVTLFPTTTTDATPSTTEAPDQSYDEMGGDFSMLGISNPQDLDLIEPFNPQPDCVRPPCDSGVLPSYEQSRTRFTEDQPRQESQDFRKETLVSIMMPTKRRSMSLPPPPPTFQTPRVTRNEASQSCV